MHQCTASRKTEGPKVHQNQHQKHPGEARGQAPRSAWPAAKPALRTAKTPVSVSESVAGPSPRTSEESTCVKSGTESTRARRGDKRGALRFSSAPLSSGGVLPHWLKLCVRRTCRDGPLGQTCNFIGEAVVDVAMVGFVCTDDHDHIA